MALKGTVTEIGTVDVDAFVCPATFEGAVHTLFCHNKHTATVTLTIKFYDQSKGTTGDIYAVDIVAGGEFTFPKPIDLNAGDKIILSSSVAASIMATISAYTSEAVPAAKGLAPLGTWDSVFNYVANDIAEKDGSSYICITPNLNDAPPSVNWMLNAEQGLSGAGSMDDLIDDITPQLGGDLDVNGNTIISATNADVAIAPNGTGDFHVNTDDLFVDTSTGNVGISDATPAFKLDVNGTGRFVNILTSDNHMLVATTNTSPAANNVVGTAIRNNGSISINRSANASGYFGRTNDGIVVYWYSAGTTQGNVSIAGSTTSYNAFVGSHYTQLKPGQTELPLGAVVVATGEIVGSSASFTPQEIEEVVSKAQGTEMVEVVRHEPDLAAKPIDEPIYSFDEAVGEFVTKTRRIQPTRPVTKTVLRLKHGVRVSRKTGKLKRKKIVKTPRDISGVEKSEYFPHIDTTNIAGDKRVYGVWNCKLEDNTKGWSFGDDDLPVYLISQVGLYKCRVTDTNGNIENGDWLETSTRPMEAQRQAKPEKLNSTIGKALIDIDWSKVRVDRKLGYKWKLIPVTF